MPARRIRGKAAHDAGSGQATAQGPALESTRDPTTPTVQNHDRVHVFDIPESSDRRLLELRLLHHFVTHTGATFPFTHDPSTRTMWVESVPRLAITDSSLLYALLAVSALHLSETKPQDLSLRAVHQSYLHLALHSHRQGVNHLDVKNVDAACFTSVLIVINVYARLQDRAIGLTYEPPMQWLRMSNGLATMFQTAADQWLRGNPGSAVNALIKSASSLSNCDSLYAEGSREEFAHLLLPVMSEGRCQKEGCEEGEGDDEEKMEDSETREAYKKTVSYIGAIYLASKAGEHDMEICRRLMAFAVLIPNKMIELIEEKRPRALVILAHYFATAGPLAKIWWIGHVMRKEVKAIQRWLPAKWQDLMHWPLKMLEEDSYV